MICTSKFNQQNIKRLISFISKTNMISTPKLIFINFLFVYEVLLKIIINIEVYNMLVMVIWFYIFSLVNFNY